MNTSQDYKNIYSAIIKMRTEIAPIARTRTASMGKYSYRYATLDSVIELLNVVLPKYNLGWVQTIGTADGRQTLTTRIIHESGEWIEDTLALPQVRGDSGKNENQELGASITYFKRYALSAMFGIATDDDTDGVAEVRERKQQVRATARAAQQQTETMDEERMADCAGVQIHSPTPAQPLPAVSRENSLNFTDIIKSTGDAAIDAAILELVTKQHRGRQIFSQKTVAWLNGIIEKKTPQESLAKANEAANKRINDINKELGNSAA